MKTDLEEYWRITSEDALCEAGLAATQEQIDEVGWRFQRAAEVHGEYTGAYLIPDPMREENAKLLTLLNKERSKVFCRECQGTGRLIENFGPVGRSSNSECWKCHGEGKLDP
jgi:hypothetical protein